MKWTLLSVSIIGIVCSSILMQSIPHRHRENHKIFLKKEAAYHYVEMAAAAAKDGIELIPISGYRSRKEQAFLYKKYGPPRAAPPGSSSHEEGLAIDFVSVERLVPFSKVNAKTKKHIQRICKKHDKGWFCPTTTYWWLYKNAKRFHYLQTINKEPWHWEFVKQDYGDEQCMIF